MGSNDIVIEVQNCGTASQLRLNRHPQLLRSNRISNRLGDFSCGRVAGRGSRSLIAAGSAMEICFGGLCCRFDGVGRGDRGYPGCMMIGEFPSLFVLCISFTLQIRFHFPHFLYE